MQVIPRPPGARRVERPEGVLGRACDGSLFSMGAVRRVFAGSPTAAPGASRPVAAVLCVLSPVPEGAGGEEAEASLLFIRRATSLRSNPGEIAFPGGFIEPGESPLDAALREAREEVGLRAGELDILGELPPVVAARRAVPVLPFVAAARSRLSPAPSRDEVDAILQIPLKALAAPGCYWAEQWEDAAGTTRLMHFFDLGEDVLWGATARMVDLLFARLVSRGCAGRTDGPPTARTPPASRSTR